jgi:hypothetical protein
MNPTDLLLNVEIVAPSPRGYFFIINSTPGDVSTSVTTAHFIPSLVRCPLIFHNGMQ